MVHLTKLFRVFFLTQIFSSQSSSKALAWVFCSEEEGGGTCPEDTTCCPTKTPGISACVPVVKPGGKCCGDDSFTGCRVGYECAVVSDDDSPSIADGRTTEGPTSKSITDHRYCRVTSEALESDPLARNTPRYNLCRVPTEMQNMYGFPINVSSGRGGYYNHSETVVEEERDLYHLAYYSSAGSITSERQKLENREENLRLENVEKAVIVIHGSRRDADDYFCAGLSLIQDEAQTDDSVMIIAPKFVSIYDDMTKEPGNSRFLVWDDYVEAYDWYLWHVWRYGADATNAPISSYRALDSLIEHLLLDVDRFPNLQQITLVGHSAGGQTLQRWALLSNSPAWEAMNIRVIVANPRSYAYLDGRRWFDDGLEPTTMKDNPTVTNADYTVTKVHARKKVVTTVNGTRPKTKEVFRRPAPNDEVETFCPWYNHWLWGLEDGGELLCPYRDSTVAESGSSSAIAKRYASRNVIYLSGEYDTIPQTNDRCANSIQGEHRHERAIRFFRGLQEYFGKPVHALHTIPQSNHDHSFMFQSRFGRNAILGSPV